MLLEISANFPAVHGFSAAGSLDPEAQGGGAEHGQEQEDQAAAPPNISSPGGGKIGVDISFPLKNDNL
jgi:hypothetical protein